MLPKILTRITRWGSLYFWRRLRRLVVGGLVLLLLVSCFGMSDFKAHKAFIADEVVGNAQIKYSYFDAKSAEAIFYAHTPNLRESASDSIVFWIHGTPGAWTELGRILIEPQSMAWLSVDRPGWGKSRKTLEGDQRAWQQHREIYADFDQQLALLKPMLSALAKEYPSKKIIIGGHSLGASIGLALSAELLQEGVDIDGLVLFAGGYSPKLMQARWYHKLAKTRLGKWFTGEELTRANEEMLVLSQGLEKTIKVWQGLDSQIPIYVIQGGKDFLVPRANALWLQESLPGKNVQVFVDEDYGHLWHIQRPEVIADCAQALAADKPANCRAAVFEEHKSG